MSKDRPPRHRNVTLLGIAALPSSLLFGWLCEDFGPLVAIGWGAGLAAIAACLVLGFGFRSPTV
ncbi:MAG: hypothetical protein HYV60_22095 [Planctomycetia bacterium]|nr:hypothetical protein [Planctomycetia bacterium]